MSVLNTIGKDYHSVPQSEASGVLAKVSDAIARAMASGLKAKRTVGDLLNAVASSGLAVAAASEGNDRSWKADARETALSNYIVSVGIGKADASAWRHYANGETARELADMPTPLAVSAYRYIETDTPVAAIAELLKAEFGGTDAPTPTRDNIGKAAHVAGIGTDAAATIGDKKADTPVPDSETDAPETDAARVRSLVSELRVIVSEGYTLPKGIVRHLETTMKASKKATPVAIAN